MAQKNNEIERLNSHRELQGSKHMCCVLSVYV